MYLTNVVTHLSQQGYCALCAIWQPDFKPKKQENTIVDILHQHTNETLINRLCVYVLLPHPECLYLYTWCGNVTSFLEMRIIKAVEVVADIVLFDGCDSKVLFTTRHLSCVETMRQPRPTG